MPEHSAAPKPQDPQEPSAAAPAPPRPEDFPAPGFIPPREEVSDELALALAFAYPEGVKELSAEEADGLDDRAMGARLRESDYDVFLVRAPEPVAPDEPIPAYWREWGVVDNTLGEMDEARFLTKEAALAWINMPKFSDTGRIAATADEELFAARGGLAAVNARRLAKFPPMPEFITCEFPLFKDGGHKKAAFRYVAPKGKKTSFWRLEMPPKLKLRLPAGSQYLEAGTKRVITVKADDPPLPVSFFTLSLPKPAMSNPDEAHGYAKLTLSGKHSGGSGKYTLRDWRPNPEGSHFTYEVRADELAAALDEYVAARRRWAAERAAAAQQAPKRNPRGKAKGRGEGVGTIPIDFGERRKADPAPARSRRAPKLTSEVEAKALKKAGIKTKAEADRERARRKAAREKYREEHHVAPDPIVTKVDPATLSAAARHALRTSLISDSAKPKASAVDRVSALRAAGSLRVSDGELARLKANPTVGRIKQIANRRGVAADVRAELLEAVDHMAAPISERTRAAVLAGVASGEIRASASALKGFQPDAAPPADNLEAWSLVSGRPGTEAYRAVKAAIEEAPEPPRPSTAPPASPRRDKAPDRGADAGLRPATFREAARAPESLGDPAKAAQASQK